MKQLAMFLVGLFMCVGAFADNTPTSKGYVDTQVGTLQDSVPAVDTNTVLTTTNASGEIGEKKIYDSSQSYSEQTDALVTAADANAAVQQAIDTEFVCIEWAPNADQTPENCYIWKNRNVTKPAKNLFNKNNLTRIYGWFPNTGSSWAYVPSGYSIRVACKPNTTYTASYHGNSEQAVLNFASTYRDDVPTAENTNITCTNSIRYEHPTKNTPVTITTGPNDKWLIVQYNVKEPQNTDMANNLQIEEGAIATAYEPYKNLYLPSGD